jgi:hypothetical protein
MQIKFKYSHHFITHPKSDGIYVIICRRAQSTLESNPASTLVAVIYCSGFLFLVDQIFARHILNWVYFQVLYRTAHDGCFILDINQVGTVSFPHKYQNGAKYESGRFTKH